MAVIPQLMGFGRITSQVKEILDTHENAVMKYFNTAIERLERKVDNLTTENAVLKKEMVDLKPSILFYSDTTDEKLLEVITKVSQVYVVNPLLRNVVKWSDTL